MRTISQKKYRPNDMAITTPRTNNVQSAGLFVLRAFRKSLIDSYISYKAALHTCTKYPWETHRGDRDTTRALYHRERKTLRASAISWGL